MPRTRLAQAEPLHVVEAMPTTLRDITECNPDLHSEILPSGRRRTGAYARKRVCTKPKLVMLSEADEQRMLALAAEWGTSASGAIKRALEEASAALGLEGRVRK